MEPRPPIRKSMKRYEIPGGIRFLTFSCEQRLQLFRNPAIRAVFEAALRATHLRFRFELFAWVIMPEHNHLLLRPNVEAPVARILKFIKLAVSERVIPRWREIDAPILRKIVQPDGRYRFWQKGGGFDRNVRGEGAFMKHIRYIHRNPVERGLVQNPEDWKSSSVRWWMGNREGELPCDPPPGDPRAWARWRGFM